MRVVLVMLVDSHAAISRSTPPLNGYAKYPADEINDDNKVSATPLDKVYEHGFYPNKDGFKLLMGEDFEIFDQWVEILPTDQVVPVEVEYDPITGRQVQIVEPE